jgi:hypothetical protein
MLKRATCDRRRARVRRSGAGLFCLLSCAGCVLPDVGVRSESQEEGSSRQKPPGEQGSSGSGGTAADAEPKPVEDSASDPEAGTPADAAAPRAGAGGSAGASDASVTAGAGGNAVSAGSGGTGGTNANDGGCTETCGECLKDADCEARLGSKATCVDKTCFAPAAQCEADEDCLARGPEYMGGRCADRQCLPNPKWRCEPAPTPTASSTVELIVPVIDALALTYVPNIPLVACSKLDYACDEPVVKATTGMDGRARLTVPGNFAGYVEQTESTGFGPGLYFPPGLLPMDTELRNFPIFRTGSTTGLALALGAALDPVRGHIMLVAEDCMGNALAGVAFSTPQADMKSVQFYVRDQTPTTSVMDTPPEGTGGYMNLPPGVTAITAKEVKTGIELATVTVLIRAGFISMLYVRPISRGTISGSAL